MLPLACGAKLKEVKIVIEFRNVSKVYDSTAVSYTHLDVYKRQSQIKAVSAVRFTNKQIVLTAAEGYSFMQNTANARDLSLIHI